MNLKIEYQERTADEVFSYFAQGYSLPDGYELSRAEWFYDPAKGKVIFKLFLLSCPASNGGPRRRKARCKAPGRRPGVAVR